MKKIMQFLIFIALAFFSATCSKKTNDDKMKEQNEINSLKSKISQYANAYIKYDETALDSNRRKIVELFYLAGKIIDTLFLKQAYSKNLEILAELKKSQKELDKLRLKYFEINFGPFDRFDDDKPFIGDLQKPMGANFYPMI